MQPSIPQVIVAVINSDCRHSGGQRERAASEKNGGPVFGWTGLELYTYRLLDDKDPGPAGGVTSF
jgi:hypothetical protein